jgi:hypothetical protein
MSATLCCGFPPQLNLILAALSNPVDYARLTSAARQLKEEEWVSFAAFAVERHRVGPLLWSVLNKNCRDIDVPAKVMDILAVHAKKNAVKTLLDKVELSRLLALMNQAGIEPIVMKGWTWDELVLGRPSGLRSSIDIDLLVERKELDAALEYLLMAGYKAIAGETLVGKARRDFLLRFDKEIVLDHPDGFHLELHCRPFRNPRLFPQESWGTEVKEISVGGQITRMRLPRLSTALVYLALHGFFHRWERAKWLADLPPLLSKLEENDWAEVKQITSQFGIQVPVGVALHLAEDLLDQRGHRSRAFQCNTSYYFSAICCQELMQERVAEEGATFARKWRQRNFYFRSSNRITLFISGVGALGVSQRDVMGISLPKELHWVYYFIGLIRRVLRDGWILLRTGVSALLCAKF